jgi:hypothetical protein
VTPFQHVEYGRDVSTVTAMMRCNVCDLDLENSSGHEAKRSNSGWSIWRYLVVWEQQSRLTFELVFVGCSS